MLQKSSVSKPTQILPNQRKAGGGEVGSFEFFNITVPSVFGGLVVCMMVEWAFEDAELSVVFY